VIAYSALKRVGLLDSNINKPVMSCNLQHSMMSYYLDYAIANVMYY